jgi:hypothetical protein
LGERRLVAPGANRQNAALELDIDPIWTDARDDGSDDNVVGCLIDVDGQIRCPGR